MNGHGVTVGHGNIEVGKAVEVDLPPQVHGDLNETPVMAALDVKLMKAVMVLDIGLFFSRLVETSHLFQTGLHFGKGFWADLICGQTGSQTFQIGQNRISFLNVFRGYLANGDPFPLVK
jgi:hypothetical protein